MIETNWKFCNGKFFVKLIDNISETFLALKSMIVAFKRMFFTLKRTFLKGLSIRVFHQLPKKRSKYITRKLTKVG